MTTPTTTTTFLAAAEHAGRWKAGCGKAPHYTARGFLTTGWSCLACPVDGCEWHHDVREDAPPAPASLEALVREHVAGHDVLDVLASLTAARKATAAVREATDRAWDVVQLHRLRAIQRGEPTYADPVAQMLSAALVCSDDHQAVRDEIATLQP